MFKRFKLSTKIMLLGVGITVAFSAVFAWVYPHYKQNLYDGKYVKTQHLVEAAASTITGYVKQAESGALSKDEAQKQAMAAIKSMRYDEKNYFWINDTQPAMIMHPIKPALDGKDLSQTKDPNGKRLFVAFVEACRSKGEGFVDYYWPKPGAEQPVAKISYVKLVPSWNWIVGSGVYIDDVEAEAAALFWFLLIFGGAIAVLALLCSYLTVRSIARPIHAIIAGLNEGADQVASAASEVSSAGQSLAEGSSEQAASLEETSASLEEMASMTQQNADNAGQADKLMTEANRMVGNANEAMSSLTTSMSQIAEASEETSKIIKTIDEIAFQTNLLALNAAVEAARAGEAGAGFAVVADEVRNLAIRAADAAKNTAEMIEDTVSKTNAGSDLVTQTNDAFGQVADGTAKVGELVGEISAASKEQSQGIQQVNSAVREMDKVTQQTAANAEESASAAEELSAQSEQMKAIVRDLNSLVEGHGGHRKRAPKGDSVVSKLKKAVPGKILPTKRPSASPAPVQHAEAVDAAKFIPLDDDQFKDF